jgi:hypothetical protein
MLPRLVPLNLSQETVERYRMDMRKDLGEEEGKEQMFCVTIGRKPEENMSR